MKKFLLAGFVLMLAVSGCGDKSSAPPSIPKATEPPKSAEPAAKPESAVQAPATQQAGNRDEILARHMKCREEKGADCFKILEETKGGAAPAAPQQQNDKKAHNDAVMARHMKCRQDKGADCFKILEEMQK